MATIVRVGGDGADIDGTILASMEHRTGIYSYKFTAPKDGVYLIATYIGGYAADQGSGIVCSSDCTVVLNKGWSARYGGKMGRNVIAKMPKGGTASLGIGVQDDGTGSTILGYYVAQLF